MGHPIVENCTPFAFETLFLVDEEFRPVAVPVVKATLTVQADGRCLIAEQQVPLTLAGELWGDDPECSSYKYEPEVAFTKATTDVVMIGHAYAPGPDTREMKVAFRLGPVGKEVLVCGERLWFKAMGFVSMSGAARFEKMPLTYERAFGGWDRDHPDRRKHSHEPRNPVGTGYRDHGGFVEGIRLPNLEDPRNRIKSFGDKPGPAGFGFVSPHWQPRATLAGTFDEAWQKSRAPLLPKDFDRRHLNAASAGLVTPGYLRGDEQGVVIGAVPEGRMAFVLPGLPPPAVQVRMADGAPLAPTMNLDTVIVEPDQRRILLLWRGHVPLRVGPHDVREVTVET
jgi:hypothetical protein